MPNKQLKISVLSLLVITAGLLLWHRYGMNLRVEVSPQSEYAMQANDDRWEGGASVASLHRDADALRMHCLLKKQYPWPYCEIIVEIAEPPNGLDMRNFDYVLLDIETTGNSALPIKIYLRHFDPAYSKPDLHSTFKINEIRYLPNETERPLKLPINHFMAASWWIQEQNIPPQQAAPDLSNIVNLEVATDDSAPDGEYQVIIRSILLHGKWLNDYQMTTLVLAIWILSAIYYLLVSLWHFKRTIQAMHTRQQQLEQINAALELQRNELQNMATHDPLTGAYNRLGLRNKLYEQIFQPEKESAPLSAVFIDIDEYKAINDRYGHEAGDEILKSLVTFIESRTRGGDILCRWGGDEFILFCSDTTLNISIRLAQKLRVAIVNHIWHRNIKVTCSFGVSQMIPGEDIAEFIKRADEQLYLAKNSGRNCVKPDTADDRLELASSA